MSKILILSTVHHYQDARIFKEITSLKKNYSDINFMVRTEKENDFIENGVKIISLPSTNSIIDRVKLQRLAWEKIKNLMPEIIHFHDPELIVLGFLVRKFMNIKIIFDIHENISASFKDNVWLPRYLKPILPFLYNRFEKFLIKKFNALIIAETSYRQIYGSKPIEILNFPILKRNIAEVKNFEEPISFVYTGVVWERRGIFQMLNLVDRLIKNGSNIKFNLVGQFVSGSLKSKVENFIVEHNLESVVQIYGRKTILEVYKILEKSHVGLSLMKDIENYKESLSSKIFDYMSMSIPYVVSDFEIYQKYTVEANTGITVNYNDDDEIYDKTLKLISDKEKLKELGNNGRIYSQNEWNWESQEIKLLNLYRELLK